MDQCSYTLVLPAETHPDVLRRLVALFTGSLEAWEVVDGWAAASVVREAGQSLPMVESLIDRLQTWGLQLPFTLVEHATASSVGECHRYAPGLGTLSQPWAHGQVWVDPTRLERLVDDYPGPTEDLARSIRSDVLGWRWVEACPAPLEL